MILIIPNKITSVDYVKTEESVYHISESTKQAEKEYKIRPVWVEKMIHRGLYKCLKFDNTTKWYMHLPGSVQEYET